MGRFVKKGKNWPYRSGFEKRMAEYLGTKKIAFDYEATTFPIKTQVPRCRCADCHSNNIYQDSVYTPDFKIGTVYVEGKGRLTAKEKRRIMGLIGGKPIDFRLVFMRNNPIYPRSKTRYLDWAKAMSIPACIGPELPEAWVLEFKNIKKRERNGKTKAKSSGL
jgi:hypothetical protein